MYQREMLKNSRWMMMDLQVCYTLANVCVQLAMHNYNEKKKNGVNV